MRLRSRRDGTTLLGPLDLEVAAGERVALVGPSGAGKTLTARLACLPPPDDLLLAGTVTVAGRSGLLAQESATALDPRSTVGRQLGLVARARTRDRAAARAAVGDVLAELGLAPDVADRHPTVLSGGQRQRAALALALLADPDLLVVDEPTSALDPVTAAEVVTTVRRALDRRRAALLLVTHDPGVAAALCDRVVRLEGGRVLGGSGPQVPRAPASRAPATGGTGAAGGTGAPVLAWEGVTRTWRPRSGRRHGVEVGVRDVTLRVRAEEHVAVLGASGAGKSTLVRLAEGRERPASGRVLGVPGRGRTPALQSVPQDAGGSLTPWRTVRQLLAEALLVDRDGDVEERTARLLGVVRLEAGLLDRRPGALSGGQRQRVAIARALAAGPRVLVGDEMLSALDAPTRGEVVAALRTHADATATTLIVCTHDLDVAAGLADRVVVLDGGRVVDDGPVGLLDGDGTAGSPALRALRHASSRLSGAGVP